MQVDMMEYVGKYYSLYVNKNYTLLNELYNENEDNWLKHNITFPVYCFMKFITMRETIMDQNEEPKGHIFRTPFEELLTQYPIK